MLPQWMLQSAKADTPLAAVPLRPGRTRPSFVRRALGGFARLLEEMLKNQQTASAPGLLQQLDARAKLVALLGLIVVASLLQHLYTLLLAYLLSLLLAALSRLPAHRLVRVWLAVPLFSAAIILPAILNIITPGPTLVVLGNTAGLHIGPWSLPEQITITVPGVAIAARFILRVAVCVTLALLIAATTRPDRLFRGLYAVGVPRLFVTLLGMMARYLEAFLRAAQEIHLAKISRTIAQGSLRQEQSWVAAGIASLLRRTQRLGHNIFLAMLSRGYNGEVHLLEAPRWRAQEWLFLLGIACLAAMLLLLG